MTLREKALQFATRAHAGQKRKDGNLNYSTRMNDDPLEPANPKKKILGYAVYKAWKDNPKDVQVEEYFKTEDEAFSFVKKQKKDARFEWGVGAYQ